jgi:hypothetical protein
LKDYRFVAFAFPGILKLSNHQITRMKYYSGKPKGAGLFAEKRVSGQIE